MPACGRSSIRYPPASNTFPGAEQTTAPGILELGEKWINKIPKATWQGVHVTVILRIQLINCKASARGLPRQASYQRETAVDAALPAPQLAVLRRD